MSMSPVTAIITNRITREQSSHHRGYGNGSSSNQKMDMIGNQCPCITGGIGCTEDVAQAIQKVVSIHIILKDFSAFYASKHNMVQGSWCVNS
jgi:hypothetical protein